MAAVSFIRCLNGAKSSVEEASEGRSGLAIRKLCGAGHAKSLLLPSASPEQRAEVGWRARGLESIEFCASVTAMVIVRCVRNANLPLVLAASSPRYAAVVFRGNRTVTQDSTRLIYSVFERS